MSQASTTKIKSNLARKMAAPGGRTVAEALAQGEHAKTVWRAVWAHLQLPASER